MSIEPAIGWQEWLASMDGDLRDTPYAAFRAGARWALMEAADTLEAYADGADAVQDEVGYPAVQSMIEYTASANFLRAEAAAIGGDS